MIPGVGAGRGLALDIRCLRLVAARDGARADGGGVSTEHPPGIGDSEAVPHLAPGGGALFAERRGTGKETKHVREHQLCQLEAVRDHSVASQDS